jgi:hypothetical protein
MEIELFFQILNYLDKKDLKNCELISKKWEKKVLKFYKHYFYSNLFLIYKILKIKIQKKI